jgi:hypothetical protein
MMILRPTSGGTSASTHCADETGWRLILLRLLGHKELEPPLEANVGLFVDGVEVGGDEEDEVVSDKLQTQ